MSTGQSFETKRIDHLGIVAGICHEIGLIEVVNQAVGPSQRKVSCGAAVQAMVLNGLGFTRRALSLLPPSLDNTPVDRLIAPHLTAEAFTDDSLGRRLDQLFAAGVTEVFAQVARRALSVSGSAHRCSHLDSRSCHLHGQSAAEEPQMETIEVTYGCSTEHRPDRNQVVVTLISGQRAQLPVWIEAVSGTHRDKDPFPETIQACCQQVQTGEDGFFVVDSALYGAATRPTWDNTRPPSPGGGQMRSRLLGGR